MKTMKKMKTKNNTNIETYCEEGEDEEGDDDDDDGEG